MRAFATSVYGKQESSKLVRVRSMYEYAYEMLAITGGALLPCCATELVQSLDLI